MTATSPERKARIRDVLRPIFRVGDGFARSCNKSSSLEAHHPSGQQSVSFVRAAMGWREAFARYSSPLPPNRMRDQLSRCR